MESSEDHKQDECDGGVEMNSTQYDEGSPFSESTLEPSPGSQEATTHEILE